MLKDVLKSYRIILASGSPRRHQFFKALDLDFEIQLKPIDEIFPKHLKGEQISDYLAKLKSEPFLNALQPNDILITSDTIVWHNNQALGKPKDAGDAFKMIKSLSNTHHDVISSICFTTTDMQTIVNATTKVYFKNLTEDQIWYYINTFKPYDKAGAYGIQEWIGAIGISKIEGSYNNVVGLPTDLLYETLINMVSAN
ncbi:MAG: septum formation protein Maf [Winogradskyella sp.]|uniref:Maf-like protein n=1 Tax=Winogradskyella sp. TaxID=1883156 RepID=UPI000F3E207B|nr:Maf-like protein [Winogradskyella sp.]RNC86467.1 MAG: septum formation protein Maf [Winogradskyella sp.]